MKADNVRLCHGKCPKREPFFCLPAFKHDHRVEDVWVVVSVWERKQLPLYQQTFFFSSFHTNIFF